LNSKPATLGGWRDPIDRDAAVEKWLREEVIGVCDAMQSDPGRAPHADRLKKRHEPQD